MFKKTPFEIILKICISNGTNNIGTLLFIIKAMIGIYIETDNEVRLFTK